VSVAPAYVMHIISEYSTLDSSPSIEMVAMGKALVSAACCFLAIQTALATPVPRDVTTGLIVDLGYGMYRGVYDASTNLNVWKG
jgi:hypothetical protein